MGLSQVRPAPVDGRRAGPEGIAGGPGCGLSLALLLASTACLFGAKPSSARCKVLAVSLSGRENDSTQERRALQDTLGREPVCPAGPASTIGAVSGNVPWAQVEHRRQVKLQGADGDAGKLTSPPWEATTDSMPFVSGINFVTNFPQSFAKAADGCGLRYTSTTLAKVSSTLFPDIERALPCGPERHCPSGGVASRCRGPSLPALRGPDVTIQPEIPVQCEAPQLSRGGPWILGFLCSLSRVAPLPLPCGQGGDTVPPRTFSLLIALISNLLIYALEADDRADLSR